jgi:serine/threonine protein kinase/tetratricopeptide (TPR) repeat protein
MINKRYIISKKIGEGRSKVFNVIDTEFPDREVAAKFLPVLSSSEEKQFFKSEYFTLHRLDHPNIIKAFELSSVIIKDDDEDAEIDKFSPFITMEYFSGQELLSYYGLTEEKMLFNIIKQICSVLYYMHQSNYIYYDLKAENILVSEVNSKPVVKIIDLGFASFNNESGTNSVIGTPYYLAPELLKNEQHDHRVDFYSLGILLYRIVYGRFPFSSDKEIDIYKAHVEEEFILGETKYSSLLIKVISKLLKKDPVERYQNALEILIDLKISIDLDITKDFLPAKVFSDRKDALNIIGTYLKDKSSNEVFTINGFDGSGKSALLQEVYSQTSPSILVENPKTKTGFDSLKYIFKKIIFTETIFHEKESEFNNIIFELCDDKSESIVEVVKKVLNTLPAYTPFLILFDDFNLYDDFTRETLIQIIQILQVKGIKVIISESSDSDQASNGLNNLCAIQLNQFTEHQFSEFIELSYTKTFPQDELKKIVLLYSDLLPGSIKLFIKDLILLKVIKYADSQVLFETNEQTTLTLQSSHEELYRIRLSNLTTTELRLSQIISAFEISLEQTVLSALMDISSDTLKFCLNELEKKNIIESLNISNAPRINSFNFKKYIYSTINNRTKFHLVLANAIKKLFPDFNSVELSRQYEIANEFEKSIEIIQKEIDKAELIHSYIYKKLLLEKSLKLPLSEKTSIRLTIEFIKTLYKLSDYKSALENVYNLNLDKLPEQEKHELLFIKGSSLIESGNHSEGIIILQKLKEKQNDKKLVQKVIISLASAKFELNNYEAVEDYYMQIINDKSTSSEDLGKINNLMAMTEFYRSNNYQKALEYSFNALEKYNSANLPTRVAAVVLNIGTFYDALGNKSEAEKNWQNALELNSSIGNLEQEGSILINYGVFHHHNNNLEKAVDSWQLAKKIFSSIGIKYKLAFALSNIAEVLLEVCDYENSFENINSSNKLFIEIKNTENELNTYFLYGRFWFQIGNSEELGIAINKYELNLLTSSTNQDSYQLNLLSLKILYKILTDENSKNQDEIDQLFTKIKLNEDFENCIIIFYIYIEYLIKSKRFEYASGLLTSELNTKIIEQNTILQAHQYYLFGKIAQQEQGLLDLSSIEYFEKSYALLEGESVTELTWKVLFEIANGYYERGNFYKAKQPRIYAYELINLIGDNIVNKKIRNAYYNHPVRKQALEKLIQIGNQTQLNEYQKS